MKNIKRSYKRIVYCVIGRTGGHQVWYCGVYGAPRIWSRGGGWAITRHKLSEIKKYYKDAIRAGGAKKISVVRITTFVKESEYLKVLNEI